MKKPIIGISGSRTWLDNGTERAYLNHDYIHAIELAGGIPFVLPIIDDPEATKFMINSIDGLLLSGGDDVNPLYFGEEPDSMLGDIHDARDRFELLLFEEACKQKRPVFGICRGLQIMTVALGGTLWQEISRAPGERIKHAQQADRHTPTHHVNIEKGSKLEAIFGSKAAVNSYHHQAAKDPGQGARITATAADGIIEAIDWSTPDHYCHGVQWHPEAMVRQHPQMLELFKSFLKEC